MDAADPRNPGPVPPRGIVVRPQGDGFYARVYPQPRLGVARPALALVGLGVLGAVVAPFAGDAPALRAQVVGATILFGMLLGGVAFGYGFVPVEVSADDEVLDWGGERLPVSRVGSCRSEQGRLVLRARDGTELGAIVHLPPDVAAWLGRAVEASLPEEARPPA